MCSMLGAFQFLREPRIRSRLRKEAYIERMREVDRIGVNHCNFNWIFVVLLLLKNHSILKHFY